MAIFEVSWTKAIFKRYKIVLRGDSMQMILKQVPLAEIDNFIEDNDEQLINARHENLHYTNLEKT